ncbi:MAG: hypothetical protein JJ920_15760 [Roseitalea sp.]|nr:hypothetical protein [Roseitalea sp.]MBO6722366.1 hypothetical protein [Roseitalea sp.]MBO6744369.1 hypothetical protein [Roseitalea sp.]
MAALSAPAGAEQLSGQTLKDTIAGKRVYLATPFGGEFPLYYKTNGQVTGDGTALGLGQYFAPRETGRWFVQGDQLCQQFPTWYRGKVSCFTLRMTGETSLRWRRDDGYSGRARIDG